MGSIDTRIESTFKEMERAVQRLWENINVTRHACDVAFRGARAEAQNVIFRFDNIRSSAPKSMTRQETLNSLKDIRERHASKWCIIVAISIFDAWLEDVVKLLHAKFPTLKGNACLRHFSFNAPSFSTGFFLKDQAAIGLSFPAESALVAEFVKWKEARNCLVHKGGRVTDRYSKYEPLAANWKTLSPSWSDARDALAAILRIGKEIRRQLRKQVKRHQKTLGAQRGP